MKLSFSLSSKPPATRPETTAPPHAFAADSSAAADDGGATQFITEFDPSQTLDGPAQPVVLPPLENRWRPEKRMRNLIDPASAAAAGDGEGGAAMEFEAADPGAAEGDGSGMSFGLNLRQRGDGGGGGEKPVAAPAPKRKSIDSVTLERFREDMQILPDHREMEEFKDIKIEDFGRALLAGYGWKEGQGIGRNAKEDVKVFQYVRRPGTLGFGVVPGEMRPPGKKGRREPAPAPAPAPVDDSRRARRGEDGGVSAGQVVRVVDGRHAGLKGKVVGRSDGGDGAAPSVVLELLQSGAKVSVGADQVAELGSTEEERCLRKLKELKMGERESSGHRKKESSREDRKRDNKRGSDDGRRRGDEESKSWLRNHIRVRIISKEFKGGRLYLKKGEVMDVVSPTTCDISMDDSREIIQGVSQELLETALPKRGGPVLVLYGKHQGVFGNLVERNMEKEVAVVRDADSHQLFNVELEQIAEYLGDPSYLGY